MKNIIIMLFSLMLVACGGDGVDDSDNNNTTEPTSTSNTTYIIKHPFATLTKVALMDSPSALGNLVCMANNDAAVNKISFNGSDGEVCDSFDNENTTDSSIHKCPNFSPWYDITANDVDCFSNGTRLTNSEQLFLNFSNIEYAGDISNTDYLLNSTTGVTRVMDKPDLISGKTLCWAISKTPVIWKQQITDLQLINVEWAEVQFSIDRALIGGCQVLGNNAVGYVGLDTVIRK